MAGMSAAQFELIAKLLQSKEPATGAARLVLVEGKTVAEAVRLTGVLQPSVSRLVKRCKATDEAIRNAYFS